MFIVSVNHSRFSLIPKYQNHWKFCVQIACLFHSLYHNLWQHVPSKKVKQKKKHLTPASLEIAVITVEPVGKRDYSVNKMEKDPLASFIGQKALIIAIRSIQSRSFLKVFDIAHFSGAGVQAAERLATLFLRRLAMSFWNLLPTDHAPCQALTTSTKPRTLSSFYRHATLPSLRDGHITFANWVRV